MPRAIKLERFWLELQKDRWTLLMLATFTLLAFVPLWIPQVPSDMADLPSPWVSPVPWATSIGLDKVYRSLWLKLPLALLAFLIVVRSAALCETWPRLATRRRVSSLTVLAGMLFLFTSGVLQWTQSAIHTAIEAWADAPLTLPTGKTLEQVAMHSRLFWQGDTLFIPREDGVGVIAEANDSEGKPLLLTPSIHSAGQTSLRFALSEPNPEAYCALPDVGLVFRLRLSDPQTPGALDVQVYRQSSGALVSSVHIERSAYIFTPQAVLNLRQVDVKYMDGVRYPGWSLFLLGAVSLGMGWLGARLSPLSFKLSSRRRE